MVLRATATIYIAPFSVWHQPLYPSTQVFSHSLGLNKAQTQSNENFPLSERFCMEYQIISIDKTVVTNACICLPSLLLSKKSDTSHSLGMHVIHTHTQYTHTHNVCVC